MTVLLVTGGRTFCEATDGRERDLYMDERRALAFALDYIAPSAIIVGDALGADRWAVIWAERRGVPCRVFKDGERRPTPDAGLLFPGGCVRHLERAGIPVYEVNVR